MKDGYKKISSHGSISIPVAMRREAGLQPGDPMEVSMNNGTIQMKAYTPRCIFCGTTDGVKQLEGKGICTACAKKALLLLEGESTNE